MSLSRSQLPCWQLRAAKPAAVADLHRELKLPLSIARFLVTRGFGDLSQAERFLQPKLGDLRPPQGMAGLEVALERLERGVLDGELVGVFGDYDVDGITSAALVGDYLTRCGGQVTMRVARRDEGYGFGEGQARELVARGISLLVVTDCGTSDHLAIAAVVAAGVDVIALDHHRVGVETWPGLALVNPQRPDCHFPYKGLCAAGVAFYAMAALRRRLEARGRSAADPRETLDLVALGTLADVAPLDQENRVLVAKGLEALAQTSRPGLRELLRICELEGKIPTARDVGWLLGPRLNAPGRLGDAGVALECLWSRDESLAVARARECDALNLERREIQEEILAEAMAQAKQQRERSFILVSGEGWHPGVIGIVAGRIAERFERPAAVVALEGERGRASARSVEGVDLFEILQRCGDLMERYGGHAAAAGFSVRADAVGALGLALNAAAEPLVEGREASVLQVDAELELRAGDFDFCGELERLGPHGEGNPPPLFATGDVEVVSARIVGRNHLKLALRQSGCVQQAIGFGLGQKSPAEGERVDVAFTPQIDEYQGQRRVQLRPAARATERDGYCRGGPRFGPPGE